MPMSLDAYYSKLRRATNKDQLLDLMNTAKAAKKDFADDPRMKADFDQLVRDCERRLRELG